VVDSSIYKGQWEIPGSADLSEPVMIIGDTTRTALDLAEFMVTRQNIGKNENMNEFVNKKFKEFSDEQCRAYEDSQLESKYPEFRAIVKEYRDGILLFELTNEKVWAYASKDTTGLENYYEAHKKDFMWDTRLDASIYTVNDTNYVSTIRKMIEKGESDEEIEEDLGNDTLNIVRIERKKFQKDENSTIDGIKWKKGLTDNKRKGHKIEFVRVYDKLSPQPKTFEEARGLITAGYQEQLEKEWIEELRTKYPVEIEQEVLDSITE
jgi:peptidyl-prolyl cis-trans isomerase SurA